MHDHGLTDQSCSLATFLPAGNRSSDAGSALCGNASKTRNIGLVAEFYYLGRKGTIDNLLRRYIGACTLLASRSNVP